MTDIEKAVSKWRPDVWTPGPCGGEVKYHDTVTFFGYACSKCLQSFARYPDSHDIPCPPITRDLGFRLLEAMLRDCTLALVGWLEGKFYFHESPASPASEDPDLLTAIIKAAAALAEKE